MHDLETSKRMNQGAGHAPKVASDGRVCTEYHSRPINLRFYTDVEESRFFFGAYYVKDTIALQGYGPFGPMPRESALELCDLLNNLTKV